MSLNKFVQEAKKEGYDINEIEEYLKSKNLPVPSEGYEKTSGVSPRKRADVGVPLYAGKRAQDFLGRSSALPIAGDIVGTATIPVPGLGAGTGAGFGEYLRQRLQRLPQEDRRGLRAFAPTPSGLRSAGETAVTAGTLDALFKGLRYLKGAPERAGKSIERITKESKRSYPWSKFVKEIEEEGSDWLKTPEGKVAWKRIKDLGRQYVDKRGNISSRGLQFTKQYANRLAGEGGVAKSLYDTGASTAREALVGPQGIQPNLRVPYKIYGTGQKIKGLGGNILNAFKRIIPWTAGWKIMDVFGL